MTHWRAASRQCRSTAGALLLLIAVPGLTVAQGVDSLRAGSRMAGTSSDPSGFSFRLGSGLGCSPTNIGAVIWTAQVMIGVPLFEHAATLWFGIVPTLVPKEISDFGGGSGFTPIEIEYDHDLGSFGTVPFLYVNAGAGPQFGDYSVPGFFQTAMLSAGMGLREGGKAEFIGSLGLTYNNVRTIGSQFFVILNSGIYF